MSEVAPFDPERIVQVLGEYEVRYVLVGALAARLQGFPRLTADADLTPARDPDNLDRLAAALRSLDARVFTDAVPEGLPFDCTARTLERGELWNLTTDAGRIDLVFRPAGTGGFEDLAPGAVRFEVSGTGILAASLHDILRSKVAADRPQDRQDAAVIRAMLLRKPAANSTEGETV